MGPVKCEIILMKPSKIYSTGETIEGKVAISLKSATKISVMSLHLIGKASFGLFGQNTFEFFHETKTVEVNKILPSGTHKFPINWTIPYDLISTFTWKSGSINYRFLTEIKDCCSASSSLTNFSIALVQTSTSLAIQNALDLNEVSPEFRRSRGYNASYFHNSGRNGDLAATIAMDFVIDRQCYVPGEFMKFTCSITYENPDRFRKFPGVKINFDQEDSYFTNGSVTTSLTKIWQKIGPKIKPNDTIVWQDQIRIPEYCLSTPTDTPGIICVQYFLNVTADFWNSTENLRKPQFRIPIIIGVIPLERLHPQSGLPMIRYSQRPSVTVLNGNNEHVLEDFEIEEEDCPIVERPETPPPTYEEALLQRISGSSLDEDVDYSPPAYYLSMQ